MFNIGDLIIYSAHGICKIDDICEKTVAGVTRKYYVMHPVENDNQLRISTPVDNDKVKMQGLIEKEEAFELLESFKYPGAKWLDNANTRNNSYTKAVDSGNRKEIAGVANTLIRKRIELERDDKKLNQKDGKLLRYIQNILFKELAIALDTTEGQIHDMVSKRIKGN